MALHAPLAGRALGSERVHGSLLPYRTSSPASEHDARGRHLTWAAVSRSEEDSGYSEDILVSQEKVLGQHEKVLMVAGTYC
jgi:hypothetical protein